MKWLLVLVFLSAVQGANAEDLADEYQQTKQKLSEEERIHRQTLGSLYSINKKMKSMSSKRGKLTDKVLGAEVDVRQLAKAIAQLQAQVSEQRSLLSTRLKVLYRLNAPTVLSLLFSSANSVELDRNVKSLKKITDRDYKLIKNYEANLVKLKNKRAALKIKVEVLLGLQKQLLKQEDLLTNEQNSKAKLLAKLKTAQEKTLTKIQTIKAKAQFNPIYESSFFEKKGQLNSPVAADVSRAYGFLEDEEFRFKLTHKGYFYEAAKGSQVQSVFDGRVAFVDELPGYGTTVIIDHGDHYFTVYGYNQNVLVHVGESVSEGQTIGLSGFGTYHNLPGVYFEIRHFSDAIDPSHWMKNHKSESYQASQF